MQLFSAGGENDMFIHYIFMDNQFSLPTGSGLQLQVSMSGIITPGAKAGFMSRNVSGLSSRNFIVPKRA